MMFQRLKPILVGSLRRQLVVGMAVIFSMTMALFVWDQIRRQRSVLIEQQTDHAIVLSRSVATSGAVWVVSRDYGGLEGIIQSLGSYPDLGYAIVLDVKGQVLAHSDPFKVGAYLTDLPKDAQSKVYPGAGQFVDVASPVMLSNQHVGWVRIGLGSAALDAQLNAATRSGVVIALGGIGLSIMLAFLTGQRMTRRLYAIQEVADAVERGDADARVEITGADEAASLGLQFNNMLDALAQQNEKLKRSTSETKALIEAIPDVIFTNRRDGTYLAVSVSNPSILLVQEEYFLLRKAEDVLPKPVAELFMKAFSDALNLQSMQEFNYSLTIDQREMYFEARVVPFIGDTVISIVRDITARKISEDQLRRAANVFTYAGEGIMITTVAGDIVDVNNAFTHITGYEKEEILGKNPRLLSSGMHSAEFYAAMWKSLREQDRWSGEVWNRRKNGTVYAELQTVSAVRDAQGKVAEYVSLFSDITSIKEHQRQLEHIAHFDALTNLPNRLLLSDRLQQSMAHALRRGQHVAVAFLDLDGFKEVNDRHGHDVGDKLLSNLATALKDSLREGDTLARIGGDEFVAVMIDLNSAEDCVPMLTRLLEAAAASIQLGEVAWQGSASIGVTFYPQADDVESDQLLRQADQAMYQAKLAGKNRYQIFDAAQDSSLRVHHESLEHIRLALQSDEFVMHYQPKVNMRTSQVVGAEALIRWQHPEKGLLAPGIFLPVIEGHALAVEVGEWVIDTALTQIDAWHTAGLDLAISVNVGARQLQQADFVQRLKLILAKHPKVKPTSLELEVLETSALEDMTQVAQVIEACHQMGVKFALDDFGTGYSSLTYLKRLRVALLKIDQSFVRDMLDDPDDLAILQGVIGLAAAFKREVIAEGVETVAHGTALLHLGCELAQGYGIARPMPADQMPAWVATWRPDAAWCAVPNFDEASRSAKE